MAAESPGVSRSKSHVFALSFSIWLDQGHLYYLHLVPSVVYAICPQFYAWNVRYEFSAVLKFSAKLGLFGGLPFQAMTGRLIESGLFTATTAMSFRARHTTSGDDERERLYSPSDRNNENDYDPLAQSQMSLARSHASGLSRSLTLPPPRDPHTRKPIQVVFIVLGACFLLPWNGIQLSTSRFVAN